MNNIQHIESALSELNFPVSGNIIENPSVDSGYFVPVERSKSDTGATLPSGKLLSLAREKLAALGYTIDFVLHDKGKDNIEESLRASLISSFPDFIRNCFLSLDGECPKVWIDVKKHLDDESLKRLESHLDKFSELFSIKKISLINSDEYNLPTQFEVLSVLRKISPSTCEGIERGLRTAEFSIPSTSWVNHRLDALRRVGLVLRLKAGTYVLTLAALHRLGTVKGRRSPDIKRVLELARRQR